MTHIFTANSRNYESRTEPSFPDKDIFDITNTDNTNNNIIISIKDRLITTRKIPGILVLSGNKTFGRTPNKKRLYYKCIPYDKCLPVFLVPYEIKMEFSKDIKNKYVVFRFVSWTETQNHPEGVIEETLGDVDDLPAFYEYQLYCRSLHRSISELSKKTHDKIKQLGRPPRPEGAASKATASKATASKATASKATASKATASKATENNVTESILIKDIMSKSLSNIPQIQDRTESTNPYYVYCIDPEGSRDFDDGFSLQETDQTITISIYIANVVIWLDYLDLWSNITPLGSVVSTIYLPDKKRPMLPSILSDNLCSLLKDTDRFAFAMDFVFEKMPDGEISSLYKFNYTPVLIHIRNNYTYENCLRNQTVQRFLEITRKIDHESKDIYDQHNLATHRLVEYWMVEMNAKCAEHLYSHKRGIFRTCIKTISDVSSSSTNIIVNAIQEWRQLTAKYVTYNTNESTDMSHATLNRQHYVHITSPIRRLVDILNQVIMSSLTTTTTTTTINNNINPKSNEFIQTWLSNIDIINAQTKAARKVQTECELLTNCIANPLRTYKGVMFDHQDSRSCSRSYSYTVYISELKLFSKIVLPKTAIIDSIAEYEFRLYIFEKEDQTKKKIKISLV
jgi:exoribonuclease R